MLHAISDYAKMADVGIQDMQFEVKNTELSVADTFRPICRRTLKAHLHNS